MELPNLITRVQRTSDTETTYGDVSKHQQNLLHSAHNIYRYRIKLVTPISHQVFCQCPTSTMHSQLFVKIFQFSYTVIRRPQWKHFSNCSRSSLLVYQGGAGL